jgi:hypothetical protein
VTSIAEESGLMASDANVEVAVQLSDEVRDDGIALE